MLEGACHITAHSMSMSIKYDLCEYVNLNLIKY